MFAFIPNSMLDFKILKSKSKFYAHTFGDMHKILQSAKIADLSSMHKVGALKTLSLSEYRANASLQTSKIWGKNLPIKPS